MSSSWDWPHDTAKKAALPYFWIGSIVAVVTCPAVILAHHLWREALGAPSFLTFWVRVEDVPIGSWVIINLATYWIAYPYAILGWMESASRMSFYEHPQESPTQTNAANNLAGIATLSLLANGFLISFLCGFPQYKWFNAAVGIFAYAFIPAFLNTFLLTRMRKEMEPMYAEMRTTLIEVANNRRQREGSISDKEFFDVQAPVVKPLEIAPEQNQSKISRR